SDAESIATLKQFAGTQGWPDTVIQPGNIDDAARYLKSNPSPKVLFVDILAADTVAASLDTLADVCDPNIKVIVSGKVNEYSFYCWLLEVGIANYLLKPFTLLSIEAAYKKATTAAAQPARAEEVKKDAKVITVIGARG